MAYVDAYPEFLTQLGAAWRPGGMLLTEQVLDAALDRLNMPGKRYRDAPEAYDSQREHGEHGEHDGHGDTDDTLDDAMRRMGGRRRGPAVAVDVGCGNGATVALLRQRGMMALGVDLNPFGDNTVRADAARLPMPSGYVDLVVSECVLSLLSNPQQALAEWSRVLRKNGMLMLADICLRESSSQIERDGAVPVLETARRLAGAGFSLELWEDHSRELSALTSSLSYNEANLADLCRWLGTSCTASSLPRFGYGVWLARKEV